MKLKDNIPLERLSDYGFIKDPVNCDHPEDTYYHLNNYYIQIHDNFRITVNMFSKRIEILCLSDGQGVENTSNLDVLYDLFADDLIEK